MQLRTDSPLRGIATRVGVLVALVAVAVGLRAGSPGGASSRAWDAHDLLHGVGTGFQIALLVWIVVVLVLLVANRGGEQGGPVRRRRSSFATFLLLVAAAVAVRYLAHLHRDSAKPAKATDQPVTPRAGHGGAQDQSHLSWIAIGVVVLAAVLVAEVVRRRRRPLPADAVQVSDPLEDGLAAAARSLRDTTGLEPRQRVVAAYAAFEDALADRGVARGPSGTPAVLLDRAVQAGAPAAAAAELTGLFGAARYSLEPVTSEDVIRAERALDALQALR